MQADAAHRQRADRRAGREPHAAAIVAANHPSGIAGTDDKCRLIRDKFGFHGAVNCKAENVSDRLENLVDACSKLFEGRNVRKVMVSV